MTPNEVARVQDYLRRTFNNERIMIVRPKKEGQPVEVRLGEEFIGVLHRDEEEGEASSASHITFREKDRPPATPRPPDKVSRRCPLTPPPPRGGGGGGGGVLSTPGAPLPT